MCSVGYANSDNPPPTIALFVTKWVHTVELQSKETSPTAEEQSIMAQLRESLCEMEFEHEEGTSLAATVAKAWATFLTDVSFSPVLRWLERVLSNLLAEPDH